MPAKSIVLCCDGTSNDEEDLTNVYRLATASREIPAEQQATYYDAGVGTAGADIAGKGFGAGVSKNVREAYRFLARTYRRGDQVFVFGFSRGAYTARSLISMIHHLGLLPQSTPHRSVSKRTWRIYNAYRYRNNPVGAALLQRLRRRYGLRDIPIAGLGVWDTVGSVGFSTLRRDRTRHWYHDMALPENVQRACQALALDERRKDFTPHPWTASDSVGSHRVRQEWFAGAHSDVGGGYASKALSDIPFRWLLEQMPAGLKLPPGFLEQLEGSATGKRHDEENTFWQTRGFEARHVPHGEAIHSSVWKRMEGTLTVPHRTETHGYVPTPISEEDLKSSRTGGGPYRVGS